jgi:hypothetical protein
MIHHPVVVNKAGQSGVIAIMYPVCSSLARGYKRLLLFNNFNLFRFCTFNHGNKSTCRVRTLAAALRGAVVASSPIRPAIAGADAAAYCLNRKPYRKTTA